MLLLFLVKMVSRVHNREKTLLIDYVLHEATKQDFIKRKQSLHFLVQTESYLQSGTPMFLPQQR